MTHRNLLIVELQLILLVLVLVKYNQENVPVPVLGTQTYVWSELKELFMVPSVF